MAERRNKIDVRYQADENRFVATMKRGRKTYRSFGTTEQMARSRVRRGAGMSGG